MRGDTRPETRAAGDSTTFHLNFAERFVFSALVLLVLGGFGISETTTGDVGNRSIGALMIVVGVLWAWSSVFRIRLVVRTDHLLVYNIFRTRRVSLKDIDRVEHEYEGLKLRLRNGKYVTVTAIQKWNVSRWRGRCTRADHVAKLIMNRVREVD